MGRVAGKKLFSIMALCAMVGLLLLPIAVSLPSLAMGADALLIEVHPNPAEAWSDGAQQLSSDGFGKLMKELEPLIAAAGRE